MLMQVQLQAMPIIYDFAPSSGHPGDKISVTGKNLDQTKLLFVGGYGCDFLIDNGQHLIVTVPEAAASGPIEIYAADSVVQSQGVFTVILPSEVPVIVAVDPISGPPGLKIFLRGTNFIGTTAVLVGGADAEFVVLKNNRIVVTVPPKAQSGPIQIMTQMGASKSPEVFNVTLPVPLPQIISFKPNKGSNGTDVVITGSSLTGIKNVLFGGMPAEFHQVDETSVVVKVPAGAGSGSITIQTANGSTTSEDDWDVLTEPRMPRIDGFSEWQGKYGDKIRIRGGGFGGTQRVYLAAVPVEFTVLSASEIELVIPKNGSSGAVVINTASGQIASDMVLVVSVPNTPPPLAPKVSAAGLRTGGQVQFQFLAEPFHPYLVEYADVLSSATQPEWNQLSTEQPRGIPQVATVQDTSLAPSRFYRVRPNLSGFLNWDFELGLVGWTATGDAFGNQPVWGEAYLKSQTETSDLVNRIGGDYWNVRVHLGHHGDYWIGTGQQHPEQGSPLVEDPTPLDTHTGTLTSPDFRLGQPWVSFLIGGGFSAAHTVSDIPYVEIDARPNNDLERTVWRYAYADAGGGFFRISTAYVLDGDKEMMRRHVVNLDNVLNHIVHVRIVDNSPKGHINVDDFRFSTADPRPDLISVGGIYRDQDAPVWGVADTHTHPVANLGFGGQLISGCCVGEPQDALQSCEGSHRVGGAGGCIPFGPVCAPSILLAQLVGTTGHATGGYQYGFDGWPSVLEQGVHQQMYIDWIRRAWQGGLRLMVAHAVHARILADMYFSTGDDKGDIPVAEAQIRAIKAMAAANFDFMEIALTPRDARRIIHSGKLAIVLGIEQDRPFLVPGAGTTDAAINNSIADAYTRLGVRHLFMMHLGDNPYGGFAFYNSLWIYNSWYLNGSYPVALNPATVGITDPLEWRFEASGFMQVGSFFLGVAAFPPAPIYSGGANINARPLQPAGTTFIRGMMRHGMVIDIDHMGLVTKGGVLDLAEAQHYPVISGHSGFTELAWNGAETSIMDKKAAESDLTPTLVARLRAMNGMVSPITIAKDFRAWGTKVAEDMPGSAKTWAQSYLYAIGHMGGRNVGLATDFGGLIHGSGPRFGMKAAFVVKEDDLRKGARAVNLRNQRNGVRYAEPINDYREHRFQGPNSASPLYDGDQKEYWEAIALFQSGADPDHVAYPKPRTERIKYLSRGMRTRDEAQLAAALIDLPPLIPGDSPHEVRAGYYVRNGLVPRVGDDLRVAQIYDKLLPIWGKWNDMQGSNVPLHRCTMSCVVENDPAKPFVKDWDINLDGMAHFGMLPDFLQDLKNCGLDREDLKPLFNSAEDYIRLWERSEQARLVP